MTWDHSTTSFFININQCVLLTLIIVEKRLKRKAVSSHFPILSCRGMKQYTRMGVEDLSLLCK